MTDDKLYRIRHSTAHIMAQAVLERIPEAKPTIGPPIKEGFYYDFDLPRPIEEAELADIESRMKEIIKQDFKFEYQTITKDEAQDLFGHNPYKMELVNDILEKRVDENGDPLPEGVEPTLSTYQQDTFRDLCRGPHVESTRFINPESIKLLSVAGAYWRGSENNKMLQRIYGTAWHSPKELKAFLQKREEALQRDHRVLGKALEIFHFDPTAPGMPYWLPNGMVILNELLNFWRVEHAKCGYQEIATPLINEKKLWDISGHWEHYKDNMFVIPVSDQVTYGVKPMNCPNAMVVFNLKTRSYRDLPLRFSDCDILHRHERSGTLHGLLRVQHIQQDDAHIFIREDQIEEEYGRIFEIVERFYKVFDMSYSFRLGTRPEKYVGDIETWDKAEAALLNILKAKVGEGNFKVLEGDGAFYGPKIDILMHDVLDREWQMGTIQLDFQLPRRFNCQYVDQDGQKKTPVVVHRVVYGSLERFIGILIEQTKGHFPVWVSPIQVCVIPITAEQMDYADGVLGQLKEAGLRAEIDDSSERFNNKIRLAQTKKIPYMLVIGKKEVESGTVAVRLRTGKNLGEMDVSGFIGLATTAIGEKHAQL